jgi:AcrR family transcriptional regulator
MNEQSSAPLSGRRAQAARNDRRILEAAREVFVADPGAPISAVAKHAGVGISALYRRYASKEELLRQLSAEGLERYIAAAEAALSDDADPWTAFTGFMRRVVDADTHSLTLRLAGTFAPTEELYRRAEHAQQLNIKLLQQTKAAGAIPPTSSSTTSPSCSSSSPPSGSATKRGRVSFDSATWPFISRRFTAPPVTRCRGRRRAGKRSASAGRASRAR